MGFTNSDLSERKKLVWAGLKKDRSDRSVIAKEVELLKEHVGDWSTYETDVDEDLTSYADFNTYLTNAGFTQDEADTFEEKVKNNYSSWSDHESFVVTNAQSYPGYKNGFGTAVGLSGETETEDGDPVAGIRVHDSAGVSYAGVPVEEGTVEVYGRRVEFSEQAPPRAEDGTINYSNQTIEPSTVEDIYADVNISADVENTNSGARRETVTLTEDGDVVREKTVEIAANATKTVSFTVTKETTQCNDYAIGPLAAETVCWVHPGLIR